MQLPLPALLLALPGCGRALDAPVVPPEPDPPAQSAQGEVDAPDPEPTRSGPVALGPTQPCEPSDGGEGPFTLHDAGPAWSTQPFDATSRSLFVGGGLAAGDLDGDGRLDLVVSGDTQPVGYWVQADDLQLLDRSATLPPLPLDTTGITVVDLDDDLDLDLVVSSFRDGLHALENDGAGMFTEATTRFGLPSDPSRRYLSSSWADWDRDGDLDGLVAAYGALVRDGRLPPGDPSHLLLRGPEGYVDLVPTLEEEHPLRTGHTFAGAFTDLDGDGWLDLYLVNDFGWVWPSLPLWNRSGTLELRDDGALELPRENMGLGIGDVDGDGAPDVLVTAWDDVGLFVSDPSGLWFEESSARGLRPDFSRGQRVAWANELADVDNDGDLDAILVFGFLDVRSNNENPFEQPDALFLQDETGSFVDVAPSWGLDQRGVGRGLLVADLDGNGALDLVKTDVQGPPRIFRQRCTAAAWVTVALRQPAPNPYAIGARVRVIAPARTWTTELRAGGTAYGAGTPPEVHVGLGPVDVVDIEVRWPDGALSVYPRIPTRRRVTVTRP